MRVTDYFVAKKILSVRVWVKKKSKLSYALNNVCVVWSPFMNSDYAFGAFGVSLYSLHVRFSIRLFLLAVHTLLALFLFF